ncbi:zinc metalloproteinase nas-15-like [Panulirus ornatus]|uniref:zinc metalloproteinase nas-15-like n=1 Tax=Panulirus ornatus TaxID=150431 RepID=UPI003A8884B6
MRTCLAVAVLLAVVAAGGWASVAAIHRTSDSNSISRFRRPHRGARPTTTPLLPESVADGDPESILVELDTLGEPLSPDDMAAGSREKAVVPVDKDGADDPILLAGKFQGDIILTRQELARLNAQTPPHVHLRNGVSTPDKRWPDGVIPYVISKKFDTHERGVIARAMKNYEELTCVRFVPRTTEKDFVHLIKSIGCSSSVGRLGGSQAVSLGQGCLYVGIVMHELMHVIGFWHEHTRPDRDAHITVNWSNIREGMEHNFQPLAPGEVQTLGVEYDLGSVMHYGSRAFASDVKEPTIVPKESGIEIGQRRGLSLNDKRKVNLMYCKDTPVGVSTSAPTEDWCRDNDESCQEWAMAGECKVNPSHMFVNCCRSCLNHAVEEASTCGDSHRYCHSWARTGECTRSGPYMHLYCRRSCMLCHDADAQTTGAPGAERLR